MGQQQTGQGGGYGGGNWGGGGSGYGGGGYQPGMNWSGYSGQYGGGGGGNYPGSTGRQGQNRGWGPASWQGQDVQSGSRGAGYGPLSGPGALDQNGQPQDPNAGNYDWTRQQGQYNPWQQTWGGGGGRGGGGGGWGGGWSGGNMVNMPGRGWWPSGGTRGGQGQATGAPPSPVLPPAQTQQQTNALAGQQMAGGNLDAYFGATPDPQAQALKYYMQTYHPGEDPRTINAPSRAGLERAIRAGATPQQAAESAWTWQQGQGGEYNAYTKNHDTGAMFGYGYGRYAPRAVLPSAPARAPEVPMKGVGGLGNPTKGPVLPGPTNPDRDPKKGTI